MPHVIYKGIHYPIRATETILDGLIAGGADVRYSCRRGSCHTCLLQADPALVGQLPNNCLPESLRAAGMFLPCVTRCSTALELHAPDWSTCFVQGVVAKKEFLADDVVRLVIDAPPQLHWHAGQYVDLRSPTGAARAYSIASVRPLDYYLELLIQVRAGGLVSGWVADALARYDVVHLRGPVGRSYAQLDSKQTPLVLVTTRAGVGASLAVAREAKLYGLEAPVRLIYAESDPARLLMVDQLHELERDWSHFSFTRCDTVSGEEVSEAGAQLVSMQGSSTSWALMLFGDPTTVERVATQVRERRLAGAAILTNAFSAHVSET